VTRGKAQKRKAEPHNARNADDAALAAKIAEAVKAADAALAVQEKAATTVEKSKAVGLLLLEAKKLHPKVKDFEAFLKLVHGLHLSRAHDLLALAGGRKTAEELRAETWERVQKHRESKKKKLPPPPTLPEKKLPPPSVTSPDVTESAKRIAEDGGPPRAKESAEISIEQRRAENAELDLSPEERAAKASARCLAEFTVACGMWLPKMTEADQQKALLLVSEMTSGKPEAEAA
jgi:hypothetical protein